MFCSVSTVPAKNELIYPLLKLLLLTFQQKFRNHLNFS